MQYLCLNYFLTISLFGLMSQCFFLTLSFLYGALRVFRCLLRNWFPVVITSWYPSKFFSFVVGTTRHIFSYQSDGLGVDKSIESALADGCFEVKSVVSLILNLPSEWAEQSSARFLDNEDSSFSSGFHPCHRWNKKLHWIYAIREIKISYLVASLVLL
jgi:hypothetical protein